MSKGLIVKRSSCSAVFMSRSVSAVSLDQNTPTPQCSFNFAQTHSCTLQDPIHFHLMQIKEVSVSMLGITIIYYLSTFRTLPKSMKSLCNHQVFPPFPLPPPQVNSSNLGWSPPKLDNMTTIQHPNHKNCSEEYEQTTECNSYDDTLSETSTVSRSKVADYAFDCGVFG